MADTAIQETVDQEVAPEAIPEEVAPAWREPTTSVGKKLASMSDRAIERVTGGNAFLRGRLYARRKAVENLIEEEHTVKGEISVRTAEDPYVTRATYSEESDAWESSCSCPGWRGPTGHCKHVAAVMVALRDEVRPPRVKGPQQQQSKKKKKTEPIHVPGTVSAGGKRRRSRRRRRGATGADAGALEILSPRELQAKRGETRGPMDAWLPAEALDKPLEFEYRMTVRPASITVTPVLSGSRSVVPINDALGAFNMVSIDERPLFRALARNTNRGQATTAELRGEDAAEVLEMLSDRRVLLEPASMELRFANEALKPRIKLDPANGESLRVRVVFYLESNKRRFALSSGAWFEGTPGWQIDTTEGVARPLSELVTPAWLQRLYRSPAMVQSHADLPELLGESIPRVAALLGAELPDLSAVADLVDQKPLFELKANGDIIDARVRLYVRYEDQEFDVPPDEFPSPLAFLPPKKGEGRPRVVRRDIGAEMAGVQALLNQNFEVSESGEEIGGFRRRRDRVLDERHRRASRGLGSFHSRRLGGCDDSQGVGDPAGSRLERSRLAESRHEVRIGWCGRARRRATRLPRAWAPARAARRWHLRAGGPGKGGRRAHAHGGDLRDRRNERQAAAFAGRARAGPLEDGPERQGLLVGQDAVLEDRRHRRDSEHPEAADAQGRPSSVPKRWLLLARLSSRAQQRRHPRRRHGSRQDASDDRAPALGQEQVQAKAQPGGRAHLGRANWEREIRKFAPGSRRWCGRARTEVRARRARERPT